ncbi:hypothetical protein FRB94_000189 [Tulasnella sp. JGI-2019a]|nr:hypothetical protein FRB94_000189 [Tulasnella sp. JGI-2019a]
MVEGRMLPQKPDILASVITVTFIGKGRLPKKWLKSTFRVRRRHVQGALVWLKQNNPHYHNMEISDERLEAIPEDDVPEAILANVRQDEDPDAVERERDGYVPGDADSEVGEEDGEPSKADQCIKDAMTPGTNKAHSADNSDDSDHNDADDNPEADVVPLQFLGITDTDLSKASTQELMLYALANVMDESRGEGGYAVRHSNNAVNDFGRPRRGASEQEREFLQSHNPMTSAFPGLFPYGEGGIEANRDVPVSFTNHVRWALQYYDRRFSTHHSFPFVAFRIEQKQQALGSVRAHMSRQDFIRDSAILSSITADDLKLAEEEEKRGERHSNPAIQVLKRHIQAMGGRSWGRTRPERRIGPESGAHPSPKVHPHCG